ncbi:MAG: RnfABCDGE type electron transport complex subunit B [Lentisphaeria bacterium]|nr:RnfABCDGE type electron transport complex subunit B [Lentisphaeria bacterium]
MTNVILAALALAILGLVLGMLIGYAAKKFAVQTDPRIEKITELLPGANCGGCGYAGCADYARAMVEDGVSPSGCAVVSEENFQLISQALGQNSGKRERKVAVVYCSGDNDHARRVALYNGLNDCRVAAALSGGGKGCRFGCIGLGSCARSCQFGAIELRNGLAVVHPELCKGCGKCTEVCPRKLIRLVSAETKAHIYCNSLDKGPAKRKNCTAGCLACRKCVKAAPDIFNAQGFLVRAREGAEISDELIASIKCPTGALQSVADHLRSGKGKEGAA